MAQEFIQIKATTPEMQKLLDEEAESLGLKKPMSEKTPEMREAIEGIFPGTAKAIEEKKCPTCNKPIGEFRDLTSRREYLISGMCQACQDSVFGE